MVFYYRIRGGRCLNEHSHVTLAPDDIVCYVGRDKHENEYLIKYGWPGDIWFHVDGLSSAHVYFRLKNVSEVDSVPPEDLPSDSVSDMMQICKHNSIAGCKLASCKMVYTPHSNLKKMFDMEAGSVTYHDTKRCRYARCEKDRQRVKELEKTKSDDVDADFYSEMKANERRIVERKKRLRKALYDDNETSSVVVLDPLLDDLRTAKKRAGRQGDLESGLDAGLQALEGLPPAPLHCLAANGNTRQLEKPAWQKEAETRRREAVGDPDVLFLCERGYTASEAISARRSTATRSEALSRLYGMLGNRQQGLPEDAAGEDLAGARAEEKEVLLAMFGFADEDDEAAAARFRDPDDETSLDVALPITAYEPPARYGAPATVPQLKLEVYVDRGIAPRYPHEPPALALVGGGLPEASLRALTVGLRAEALEQPPGEPRIFDLLTFAGDACSELVRGETEELEAEQARARLAKAATEKARKEARGQTSTSGTFRSEAERRKYAREAIAGVGAGDRKMTSRREPDPRANAGVSGASLFDDLFS